ncbi:MAG: CpaF family protein [Candidatus Omnitrophica bacterium]|nr:CpaF family protein [Candidatus Omnitrophota bacterium]
MIRTLKDKIRKKLISSSDSLFTKDVVNKDDLRYRINQALDEILHAEQQSVSSDEREHLISELINEFIGFGPLESLLHDPEITEIMINGPKKVYVERHGKKELSAITFDDEQQLRYLIYKILAPTRRRVDETYPYVDVSLKDGSRVNIIIPPLSLDGSSITIRKFLKEIHSVEDLVDRGTLDRRMADFLVACIKAKVNILFSGATGSGKTTTLGVLSGYINNDERIVTIEDTAELHLNQEHVVRLETRPPNIEGKGEVTIRDLFKNSLRMRPGRIILGEVRGAEALDMLQAMCSGHAGSLAVLHANSPQEVIYRLETMILTTGLPITLEAIHRQIAAAVHLIVQQAQVVDGSRKITHLTQVCGLQNGQVAIEDLFTYEFDSSLVSQKKVEGRWKASGAVPVFYPLFQKMGIALSQDIFKKD